MTQQFIDDDDPQFGRMLRSVENDAAPVDYDALDRMRDLLMREFDVHAEVVAGTEDVATKGTAGPNVDGIAAEPIRPSGPISPASIESDVHDADAFVLPLNDRVNAVVTLTRVANEPPKRGAFLSAIVVAAVLMAATVSLWMTQQANSVASPMALASVLDEVAMADSLRIEAVVSGTTEEILVKQPSKARWQVQSGRYRVLDGTRFWSVDESVNVAQAEPNSLLKRVGTTRRSVGAKGDEAEGRISLLELLGVEAQRRDLVRALPVKQEEVAGVACSFYDATVPALVGGDVAGDVRIEAVVETLSRRVRSLTVWPAGRVEGKRAPIADLQLLALNEPVREEQFVLAKSLSQDGRIGKISDTQGIVTLRPALHERWTPVCQQMLLKPGDSLRTDLRGPNAVQVTLTSEVQITVGPGAFVECVSPFEVRLFGGDLQVSVPLNVEREFVLRGPKEVRKWPAISPNEERTKTQIPKRVVLRVTQDGKLFELPQTPAWLSGFEGATVGHKLGALIANVDGRNEPLTIGYHKVNVEIRDQIARTTIEESFVNHTGARLEGVFHFPLPSDASISGFGMWIGNQLVEADIVEKQRAREIFETILRERRDPGLLEWTQGNLFKARVFPIEPHSEKRIKIVYTQVLPLRGGKFRYSYGLQSDLLKLHPVRELAIDVLINSTLPISRIECPTHDVQTRYGKGHSSQVTFNAREYVPTRDFEVVCQLDGPRNDVVVVPHQRGDDGYLLVQITPPSTDGNWQREVLPNGEPVELLLLCDTSGSMDSGKRKQQAEFVAALLASLGEKDRFNLAGCDVGCVWAFAGEKSVPATAAHIEAARKFLSERGSLGWTDLGRAFEDAHKTASDGTQVVYVGDGIVTASGDSISRAVRQEDLGQEDNGKKAAVTLHAVSVGNVVEAAVLKKIAAASGGSLRAISGEMTPQKVALELLNEIAQPGIRDLQIEFRGVPVAAVYPSKLPNLAAGTQQMVLARYLPLSPFAPRKDAEGKAVAGGGVDRTERPFAERKATMPLEVVVTGKRGKETVKFSAKTSFAEAEEGNSFIPRLWARLHLDQLLSQGRNQAIQDEIIRLSEEFHIITPYTSLLVLESDADRERFGVKRRYEMRDGERFFADGRDNAKYELRQKYIAAERAWREGLRRSVLKSFASLGRDPQIQQRLSQMRYAGGGRHAGMGGPMPMSATNSSGSLLFFEDGGMLGGFGGGGGGMVGSGLGAMQDLSEFSARDDDFDGLKLIDNEMLGDRLGEWDELDVKEMAQKSERLERRLSTDEPIEELSAERELVELQVGDSDFAFDMSSPSEPGFGLSDADGEFMLGQRVHSPMGGLAPVYKRSQLGRGATDYFYRSRRGSQRVTVSSLYGSLLPQLMPAQRRADVVPDSMLWPKDAIELSTSLLRSDSLLKLPAGRGIEVRSTSESIDNRWQRATGRSSELVLFAPARWLRRPLTPGSHDVVLWRDEKEYGTYSTAIGVGQVRKSEDFERQDIPLAMEDYSLAQNSLHSAFANYVAKVVKGDGNVVRLELSQGKHLAVRVTVDSQDRVITKIEFFDRYDSKDVTRTVEFGEFAAVADRMWAKRVTTTHHHDGGDSVTTTRFTITEHEAAAFDVQFKLQNAARDNAELIHHPLPSVVKAKAAIANRKGKLEDRLVVLAHFASSQQWDNVFEQLAGIDSLPAVKGSAARDWLRTLILKRVGRNEETRQRLTAVAESLLKLTEATRHDLFIAQTIRSEAYNILSWEEYARLVEKLKPVFDRQVASTNAKSDWQDQWLQCLRQLGNWKALREQMAERLRTQQWDIGLHQQFAQDMASSGDIDAARTYLDQQIAGANWNESERQQLRDGLVNLLRNHHRRRVVVEMLERELAANPQSDDQQLYVTFLSELFMADKEDRAHELMHLWMKEVRVEKPTPSQLARMNAAIRLACGSGNGIYWGRVDERFVPDLTEIARQFAKSDDHHSHVTFILQQHPYSASDEIIKLRGEWFGFIKAEVKTLRTRHLSALVNWVLPNEPRTTSDDWLSISTVIRERWLAETDESDRQDLGNTLQAIYSQRLAETHLLPFLRERLKIATPVARNEARHQLFDALQRAAWTIENEREAIALISQLGEVATDSAEGNGSMFEAPAQVISLHKWVDAMLSARQAAEMKTLLATGHPEKLTRTEYAAKKAAFLKAAREGVSESLRVEVQQKRNGLARSDQREGRGAIPKDTPFAEGSGRGTQRLDAASNRNQMASRETATLEELLHWMTLERGYLDLQLGRDPAPVLAEAWALLGESPIETMKYASPTMPLLKQRAFVVVMNLTCRRTATEADVARLMKFLDVGIYSQSKREPAVGEDEEDEFDHETETWRWKKAKFNLLVALDRPEALERELEKWIKSDSSVAPWRKSLARLKAERGDLKTAIELFEAVRRSDELLPADHATLAKWYLAGDRRADYEQARIAYWKTMPDYQINNALQSLLQPYRQTNQPRPSTLDENVLFALRAIFEKSTSPGSYLYQLREFYDETRDFRLMGMLPETVVGKTPQQVYSVLQQVSGQVLVELRDEATSDELLKGIRAVAVSLRDSAAVSRSGTATDLRALDLLEALVERKASEVLNQPGPHVAAALTALKRAFDRDWATGEQRQMADLLAALGAISQKPLADEQVRQLNVLAQQAAVGSDDHVFINAALARAMTNYGQRDRALTVLGHAVREYERTHESGWPAHAVGPMGEYLNMLMDAQKCSVAEEIVLRHIAKPENDGQREYFKHRLVDVYQRAYASDQRVSLGEGEALLKGVRQHLLTETERANEARKAHYMQAFVGLCSSAKDRHPEVARRIIREFAFEQLPTLLTDHPVNFESVISNTAETVKTLLGSRTALEFLIERLEQYPRRSFYGWNTPWQQHGNRIAELRHEAGPLGKYEARLLALLLDELRADLRQRDNRSNRLFRKHDHLYWTAKEPEFARVSNEVLAERPESGQTAIHVAGYLYSIGYYDRAIEILFDFHKKNVLRENGLSHLVSYLHGRERFAESIGVLEPLISRSPDNLWYRTHLMRAYHRTSRPQMLADLLKATDAHFRAGGRWNENVAAQLGSICNETHLPEPAIVYLQEAIAMHLREGHRREDWQLWGYYRDLAASLTQLKRTQEAVEAAAAGVVMWPGNHHYRQETLNNLVSTLRQAPDIDGYAKWLDEQAEKDKQERPLIRKSLGRAYRELNEHAKAVAQLRIAAEVTPHDRELQIWLLELLDQLEQKDAALAQLKVLIELDPRNLDWHKQLAERLSTNEAEAERAETSIVEAFPTEAESHHALAVIRELQNRLPEAIIEWQQVAELRALEPTGLLGLANAQLHAGQFEACDATLDRLTKTKWDARFNTVKHQTEELRAQLRAAQKM